MSRMPCPQLSPVMGGYAVHVYAAGSSTWWLARAGHRARLGRTARGRRRHAGVTGAATYCGCAHQLRGRMEAERCGPQRRGAVDSCDGGQVIGVPVQTSSAVLLHVGRVSLRWSRRRYATLLPTDAGRIGRDPQVWGSQLVGAPPVRGGQRGRPVEVQTASPGVVMPACRFSFDAGRSGL